MSKKRKCLLVIDSVALAFTLGFIWINSCLSQSTSASESGGIYLTVKPMLDAIFGKDVITHIIFRKFAHFSEFFALGMEICVLYCLIYGVNKDKVVQIISAGLFVAVIDESIQILSNRGPAVIDVLIDYSGYLTACAISFAVIWLIERRSKKKGSLQ